jgi:hypothetical protein
MLFFVFLQRLAILLRTSPHPPALPSCQVPGKKHAKHKRLVDKFVYAPALLDMILTVLADKCDFLHDCPLLPNSEFKGAVARDFLVSVFSWIYSI